MVELRAHLEYLSSGENRAGCADLVTSPLRTFLSVSARSHVSKGHRDSFGFRIAYGRRTDALAILVESVLAHC